MIDVQGYGCPLFFYFFIFLFLYFCIFLNTENEHTSNVTKCNGFIGSS